MTNAGVRRALTNIIINIKIKISTHVRSILNIYPHKLLNAPLKNQLIIPVSQDLECRAL